MNRLFPNFVGGAGAVALLVLRLVAGTAFMLHGWPKIQNPFGWMGPESPVAKPFQALAALAEFGGGAAWIVGLLTPIASLGLFLTMIVAALFHITKGDPFVAPGKASYELALVYLAISLVLGLIGPGNLSVDAKLFSKDEK